MYSDSVNILKRDIKEFTMIAYGNYNYLINSYEKTSKINSIKKKLLLLKILRVFKNMLTYMGTNVFKDARVLKNKKFFQINLFH